MTKINKQKQIREGGAGFGRDEEGAVNDPTLPNLTQASFGFGGRRGEVTSTAMLDIAASGAEVMATGPCGCEWNKMCCQKLSPKTLASVSERLRPHVLPDIFWDSKAIGASVVRAMTCFRTLKMR